MAADTPKPTRAGKPKAPPFERKARGFLRASELTPAALKTAGAKRGFAELRLLTEWRAIVGEALNDVCRPVKVTYRSGTGVGLGATLVIAAEGARAPEIEMSKTAIIDRVNAFYGYRAVSRIAIDQSRAPMMQAPQPLAAAGFAEQQTAWSGAPTETTTRAEGVMDERLALALGRLEANIKRKATRTKPSR